jgi:hypothetical protein
VLTLDGEQEELKAKLKVKTSQSDGAREEMDRYLSEARKMVKVEMA